MVASSKENCQKTTITSKEVPKKRLNKNLLFILLILFFLVIGISFIKIGIPQKQESLPLYTYKINRDIDYKINLAPNNFYDDNTLEANKLYPSNLIENINLTFDYSYLASKDCYLDATYNIEANLIGEFEQKGGTNKEVWRKHYILQDEKKESNSSSTTLDLMPTLAINYKYFNQLAEMYREQNKLSINAYLDIKLNIKLKSTTKESNISETINDAITLKIPLNSTVTEITNNFQPSSTKTYYDEVKNTNNSNRIFIPVGAVFVILSFVLILLNQFNKNETSQEKYSKNINRILKEYADLIVTVNNKPDITDLRVMNLSEFADLVDVAEQSKNNIIHYQSRRKDKSTLYVIAGNYIYVYIVDDKA